MLQDRMGIFTPLLWLPEEAGIALLYRVARWRFPLLSLSRHQLCEEEAVPVPLCWGALALFWG